MSDRPTLTWEDGKSVKFFIQKDLPVQTIEDISKQITIHGGVVQTKVPRQGFVLIVPESPEGLRLAGCWDTDECPKRSFVPFFFVEECIREGRLIPQLFRKGSDKIAFHIHESVIDKDPICNSILCTGGNPMATESEADIVIANSDWSGFQALVEKFSHSRKKYVEDITWIKNCIQSGEYKHTPLVKKNFGGRMPGSKRTEFTEQDDKNLAVYLATRLPEPAMRGRTGNKIYQELCDRPEEYPWAARHPWQSWRERYKNNVHKINKMITRYLLEHPTPEDQKGVHGFVRAPLGPYKVFTSAKKSTEEGISHNPEDEDDGWGSQWEIKEGKKSPPAWSKRKDPENREAFESPLKRQRTTERIDQQSTAVAQPAQRTTLKAENEQHFVIQRGSPRISDGDIQNGDDYVEESDPEAEDSMGTQTQALLEANNEFIRRTVSIQAKSVTGKQISHDSVPFGSGIDIEVALAKIADEYGFLLSEVTQEFDHLSRDLEVTRLFFKDIREYIQQKKAQRKRH